MPKKVRPNIIKIRCSDDEKSQWKAKAETANISVANLIRRSLNTAEVERASQPKTPRKFTRADPEIIRHVAWIGNNLNQIARQINQSGISNVEQLHIDLLSIYRSLKRIKNAL